MTTRACDFSSFKRPSKPPNADSSSSEKTSSLRSSELDRSKEEPLESSNRKLETSLSVDPEMMQRTSYDYFGGSTSTFKDVTSPTIPPLYSFSSQQVDGYDSFQRPPHVNHSTMDRTTLPYDRRQKTPAKHVLVRQEGNSMASGLVFLDGGRRGVMNAHSQHCLNETMNGRRLDRSLATAKPDDVAPQYDPTEYSTMGHDGSHSGYLPVHGSNNQYGYSTHDRVNMDSNQLPPNTGTYREYQGNLGTNMSSGESGIAGCDYNTLGMPYDGTTGDVSGFANYHYNGTATATRQSTSSSFQPRQTTEEETENTEERNEYNKDTSRQRNGSSAEEFSQRTMLLRTDSAVQFEPELPDSPQHFEPSASFAMGSAFNLSQSKATPASSKSSACCNPFKKRPTDAIYGRNNLYGTKNRRSSRQNVQVTLGAGGITSTGLNFDKRYSSTKRPFCPPWQCVALTLGIAVMLFLCAALILYFYVWPSVLQPLVDKSRPIDGEWGNWRPWFECSATCGRGVQNRTRECDSPTPEDGGKFCNGRKYETRKCHAPIECPDCTRVCRVGTLTRDCRSCTCQGHVITGRITDEDGHPLSGVKVYNGSGATLLLAGTDIEGKFQFEGVCSNGHNELRLEKEMYRVSRVTPVQSVVDRKRGRVDFSMTELHLPVFIMPPENEERLVDQKVVMCCVAESEQPPTRYVWYKDNSMLDPRIYHYSLKNPSLVMPELMVWDGGNYSCEVENEAGTIKSQPATLTVHKNWTELCDPKPKDNYIALREDCEQTAFNAGSCGSTPRQSTSEAALPTDPSEVPAHSRCIKADQYPGDAPENVCHVNSNSATIRDKYCCKPTAEQEVKIHCKAKGYEYDMTLKRILSCGCEICDT